MKTLFIIFSICVVYGASAQKIDRQIIASSGDALYTNTAKITFTVGEPIIGVLSNSVTVSQGFLADASTSGTLSTSEELLNRAIKIYPNPVKDVLSIDLNDISGSVSIEIYSITGKLLKKQKINQQSNIIRLSHFRSGIYLVRLSFLHYKKNKSFKIIKQ